MSEFVGRPAVIFLGSFALLILAGAALLALPIASVGKPLSIPQAIFMAASAVCVTGLSVVDVGKEMTLFGQLVLLTLIQLGGLGVMTFYAFFFVMMGRTLPVVHRTILRETVSSISGRSHPLLLLRAVVLFTLAFEAAGGIAFYFLFLRAETPLIAFKKAVFHTISAFCNAGFSLQADSFVGWRADPWMNLILIVLIVSGGLGFITHMDLLNYLRRMWVWRRALRRHTGREPLPPRPALSLHSRIVLSTTAVLIAFGAVVIWFELLRASGYREPGLRALEALFLSVTARTAGFNTVPTDLLGTPVLFFVIILMFIGASPGSTGGGVKTTTFFILAATLWSRFQGYATVSAFRRNIPLDIVRRANTVFFMGIVVVSVFLFWLLVVEERNPLFLKAPRQFLLLLFETVSAFGTVGLSMGATSDLSPPSLLLLSLMMYIGRVGPLTTFIAFSEQLRSRPRHPDEMIMVG